MASLYIERARLDDKFCKFSKKHFLTEIYCNASLRVKIAPTLPPPIIRHIVI